jgi:hypothetical protein
VGLSAPQDFKTFEIYNPTNSVFRINDVGAQDTSGRAADTVQRSVGPRLQDTLRRR